jgi:hypothetical protein
VRTRRPVGTGAAAAAGRGGWPLAGLAGHRPRGPPRRCWSWCTCIGQATSSAELLAAAAWCCSADGHRLMHALADITAISWLSISSWSIHASRGRSAASRPSRGLRRFRWEEPCTPVSPW